MNPSHLASQNERLPTAARGLAHGDRLPLWCGISIALLFVTVIPYRIAQSGYLNDVSGAWATLADDVAHGVLYRPLVSELGYGGTRYFPLYFTLHGALTALGIPLRAAGHLLSLLSAALMVACGALGLLRRGASPWLAWSAGALTLASRTSFLGAGGIRGDILPVALGVAGLALTPREREESVVPAALLFAAAVLAKPTLVWAPGGALLALALSGRLRQGLKLSVLAGAVCVLGLLLTVWASDGEMLKSFRAVAKGGGLSPSLLLGSLALARPGEIAWIVGGLVLTLADAKRRLLHPYSAACLVCLPVMIMLYMARGMHTNHFIEAVAIGALAVGAAVAEQGAPRWPRWVFAAATVLGVSEAAVLDGMVLSRGELQAAAQALPQGRDPVLSEQPWVPLLAGEPAFLMDAFALEQTRKEFPEIDRDLLGRLDRCGFRAVVLLGRIEIAAEWYDTVRFGAGFRQHLLQNYTFSRLAGGHALYLPHCTQRQTPGPEPSPSDDTVLERGGRPNWLRVLLRETLARL